MEKRTEIHTGITKEEAYKLMEDGHKIRHEYYSDDEFLYILNGVIMDENGYSMGNRFSDFWNNRQIWKTGWSTLNGL